MHKEIVSKKHGEASFNMLYACYKRRAKKYNLIFEFTKETFKQLTSSNCNYCGIKPSQINANGTKSRINGYYIYNGIDRIDNTKGYTIDNCVPCCGQCNYAKNSLNKQDFLNWVKRIYNFNNGR